MVVCMRAALVATLGAQNHADRRHVFPSHWAACAALTWVGNAIAQDVVRLHRKIALPIEAKPRRKKAAVTSTSPQC